MIRVALDASFKPIVKPFPEVKDFAKFKLFLQGLRGGRYWAYGLIHFLMAETGMRCGEAVAISEDDLAKDYHELTILSQKPVIIKRETESGQIVRTGSEYHYRTALLSDELADQLREYCRLNRHRFVNRYIFPSSTSVYEHLQVSAMKTFNSRARKRYGLPTITNHDWRRLFVSDVNELAGLGVANVMVGHKLLATTDRYVQRALLVKKIPVVKKELEDLWVKRMSVNGSHAHK